MSLMTDEDLLSLREDMQHWLIYFEIKALDNDREASEYAEVVEFWIRQIDTDLVRHNTELLIMDFEEAIARYESNTGRVATALRAEVTQLKEEL